MKTVKNTTQLFIIAMAIFSFTFTSCKKDEDDNLTSNTDISALIVGNYTGTGVDTNDDPFISKEVKVTKVTNARVKIEPVGHNDIVAFEIDIMKVSSNITSTGEEDNDLSFDTNTSQLSFDCANGQSFAGN